ncbi:unnamed protein product [Parnassius apollo]|uniref:(apollo) hypothetical protein n=1 Tax=Parnassius apollo TaxID=110799 RepID=A0A8S3WHC6_PARAO|nr:unnamed protein product [Parnassius apollo]
MLCLNRITLWLQLSLMQCARDIGGIHQFMIFKNNTPLTIYKKKKKKKKYQKYVDPTGAELWVCTVELSHVGLPLLTVPSRIGPLRTRPCYSFEQANVEAAKIALNSIKMLRAELIQQSSQTHLQSAYTPVISSIPNCVGFPYDYINPEYQRQSTIPVTIPLWR